MTRRPDWQRALNEYLLDVQERYQQDMEVEWGTRDCCTMAFDWVHECTGDDPMAEYRGRYKTAQGAYRVLKKVTGGGLRDACIRYFGDPVSGPYGQRGDVAYIPSHDCVGIVIGAVAVFLRQERGEDDLSIFGLVKLQEVEVFRVG